MDIVIPWAMSLRGPASMVTTAIIRTPIPIIDTVIIRTPIPIIAADGRERVGLRLSGLAQEEAQPPERLLAPEPEHAALDRGHRTASNEVGRQT